MPARSVFAVRADPQQIEKWTMAAEASGCTPDEWIARLADPEADRALGILEAPTGPLPFSQIADARIADFAEALHFAITALGNEPAALVMGGILWRIQQLKPSDFLSPADQNAIREAQWIRINERRISRPR
jgi:hypothetical protein